MFKLLKRGKKRKGFIVFPIGSIIKKANLELANVMTVTDLMLWSVP